LLLAGFLLCGTAYGVYARVLGWLDGLPQLPAKYLVRSDGDTIYLPPRSDQQSPTQTKLAQAFGPRSPETDYSLYETQLEFRNGNSSVVIAAGPVPANPNSNRVPLSPFSAAVFGKPKPAHLRQPGEVTEISTIHADRAILEFDRVIHNANDMRGAKLVRLELVSDFGGVIEDPRRGMVHITNNQKSADPNRFLIVRTPGPVFYRDAKAVAGTPAAQGPDFWSDSPVEIVDRQNLPRPMGSLAPATAPIKSEDARTPETVADILAARRTPPPTVTAIGFRIYLEPDPPPGQPKPKKNPDAPLQGVRRFEFLEKVLVNLWIDGGQSFMGGSPAPANQPQPQGKLALTPPPPAIAAVTGAMGPAAYTARLMDRALLQIETRGPFAYDSEKATARFDVVPASDPKLPNDVQVTKVSVREGASSLFSQVLELELNGGPTAGAQPSGTPSIKKIHAWTYTPGRFLTLASHDESVQAYGQDLVHDPNARRTVLTGAPLYVVRERNVLSAGAPQRAATLTSEPGPAPATKPQVTVRGQGKVELYDAANGNTVTASWQKSLVQSKEVINGREQDLFVLTDNAKFEDPKADYWLKGDVLKLWLESQPQVEGKTAAIGGGQAKPSHLQALGQVTGHSAEYDIDQTDQLNVFFSEDSPKPAAVVVAPVSPAKPPAPGAPPKAGPPPVPAPKPPESPAVAKEPEKRKPPLKIRAKDIQSWVKRVPTPPAAAPAPAKPGQQPANSTKYQLERVVCEDNVAVHQDPTDPNKPRGIDILGSWLEVKGSPDGNILTVHGWPNRPGEVHQEEMSLIGPVIVLDQLHNAASVKGRGALTMPTNSDLSGSELRQPEVLVIHWRDEMDFKGALRSAKFLGKVSAKQGESWVLCHTMHVVFDRPVYFNQLERKADAAKADPKNPKAGQNEKPKIDTVFCYPAAADSGDAPDLYVTFNQVEFDANKKMVKSQQLQALELKMEAQVQDASGGEKYQCVTALGPGRVRIWQPGDRDQAGPAPNAKPPVQPMTPMQPGAKPAPAEQEMKLTVVDFRGRMTAIDKGKVFQQATFHDSVKVINVPADSPSLEFEGNILPPRGLFLRCDDKLVVWSHKKPNAPAVQHMDAMGNARIRNDDYEGWAETISQDDKLVILTGSEAIPARVKNRTNRGNDQSGKKIIYDRGSGSFRVIESFGGSLGSPPKK
jgi:hypothetical protein